MHLNELIHLACLCRNVQFSFTFSCSIMSIQHSRINLALNKPLCHSKPLHWYSNRIEIYFNRFHPGVYVNTIHCVSTMHTDKSSTIFGNENQIILITRHTVRTGARTIHKNWHRLMDKSQIQYDICLHRLPYRITSRLIWQIRLFWEYIGHS